jgi:chorismate synthase
LSANSFGNIFKVHTFGESHGPALGAVIDGCPAGLLVDIKLLENELQRRRPGHSPLVSARKETDQFEVLSGVFEGRTLGTPIAVIVRNSDARSEDYSQIKTQPRQGHADDVWKVKFGHSDHRGGGRSSGRETLARVIGGAFAKMLILHQVPKYSALAFSRQIGKHQARISVEALNEQTVEQFPARFPDTSVRIENYLLDLKERGDSVGGLAQIQITGLPVGLGEPVFFKLKAQLASALMGIGAVDAISFGEFEKDLSSGVEFHKENSNYSGIRGGISTSEPIQIFVRVKPTSSILDVAKQGRHDPCILIRALPVMESMVHLVVADFLLWSRLNKI